MNKNNQFDIVLNDLAEPGEGQNRRIDLSILGYVCRILHKTACRATGIE